ncbi:MAG: hypothetical protein NVS4B11_13930 [Ktedonobacteraceae bacterium]
MQDIICRVANLSGVFLLIKLYHSDASVYHMLQYIHENSYDNRNYRGIAYAFGAGGTG